MNSPRDSRASADDQDDFERELARRKLFVRFERFPIYMAMLAVLCLFAGLFLVFWQSRDNNELDLAIRRAMLQKPTMEIGGPFRLQNQSGSMVTDKTFIGKYVLMTFGYASCAANCQSGLVVISHVLDALGPEAGSVQPVFVSVDPDRDTPAKLQSYLDGVDTRFVGLTGATAEIARMTEIYRVYYRKIAGNNPSDYIMDHSTLIYLIDPRGDFLSAYPADVEPERVAQQLLADKTNRALGTER